MQEFPQTICMGGGWDGEQAPVPPNTDVLYGGHLDTGCELMEGDEIVGMNIDQQEKYYLHRILRMWPSGCVWSYCVWVHHSLVPFTEKNLQAMLENYHTGDMYVKRFMSPVQEDKPMVLFDMESLEPSLN